MKYIAILLLISSFTTEPTTDWQPFSSKKQLKKFEKYYAYVPSGAVVIDNKKITAGGFFMFKTETSNLDYREFLHDVKLNGNKSLLEKVDFQETELNDDIISDTYNNHPSYEAYPVLNISHEGAQEYCKWLSKKLSENWGIDADKLEVRLPTKAEWIIAAKAGKMHVPYPWGGYYIRNAKGCFLANFNSALDSGNITLNQETGKYEIVNTNEISLDKRTTPVTTYFPNDYGLYNMSGNAAEMIAEEGIAMGGSWNSTGYDIRIESEFKYEGASNQVGFRPIVSIRK